MSSVNTMTPAGYYSTCRQTGLPTGRPRCIQMIPVCHCAFSMRAALCRRAAAISKYITHVSNTPTRRINAMLYITLYIHTHFSQSINHSALLVSYYHAYTVYNITYCLYILLIYCLIHNHSFSPSLVYTQAHILSLIHKHTHTHTPTQTHTQTYTLSLRVLAW